MASEETMTGQYEKEQRIVEAFAVIDLDRTLLETSRLIKILCRQLLDHGVSLEQVEQDVRFIEQQDGQSFSLLDFFEAQYGSEIIRLVKEEVLSLIDAIDFSDELLCNGAADLLEILEMTDVPYAVLTFGETSSQEFKLEVLCRLLQRERSTLHALITPESNKAAWIADTWQKNESGNVIVPEAVYPTVSVTARHVIVIDDKKSNLVTDDDAVYGILVENKQKDNRIYLSTAEVAQMISQGKTLTDIAYLSYR